MTDNLQLHTQGTTSTQQSAGAADDHPANVVKYSYPDGATGFTYVVPQDTPTGGFDIPANANPITQLHQNETVLRGDLADKLTDLGAADGTTHTYIPPQPAEAPSGTDSLDTSSPDTVNDGGVLLDSGSGATAKALPDELVDVTPLTDADLADGTDDAPLASADQVSGDEAPKKSKKATA